MKKFKLAETNKVEKRESKINDFLQQIFTEDERPFFVSDEATLYDLYIGDEDELISKILALYEVQISKKDFSIPFWQLLDKLVQDKGKIDLG